MIYRAVRIEGTPFLVGGSANMTETVNEMEATLPEDLEQAPILNMLSIRVGSEVFWVASTDAVAANKGATRLREMARRVDQDDAFMRVRATDDGDFVEFVSPQLGYAVKAVSKYNKDGPAEYYIGAGTPWVKWNKEEETSEVMFDEDAFDYEPRKKELNELGFVEPYVWYKATREKIKTSVSDKKKWVWKANS
jgi:hypothetical protein